jgi:hypothetical protein
MGVMEDYQRVKEKLEQLQATLIGDSQVGPVLRVQDYKDMYQQYKSMLSTLASSYNKILVHDKPVIYRGKAFNNLFGRIKMEYKGPKMLLMDPASSENREVPTVGQVQWEYVPISEISNYMGKEFTSGVVYMESPTEIPELLEYKIYEETGRYIYMPNFREQTTVSGVIGEESREPISLRELDLLYEVSEYYGLGTLYYWGLMEPYIAMCYVLNNVDCSGYGYPTPAYISSEMIPQPVEHKVTIPMLIGAWVSDTQYKVYFMHEWLICGVANKWHNYAYDRVGPDARGQIIHR